MSIGAISNYMSPPAAASKEEKGQNIPGQFDQMVMTSGKLDKPLEQKTGKQEFMEYMQKSPIERMRDAWLQGRGLSEEKLEAMSPEERQAIEKQMAEDIKRQMEMSMQESQSGLSAEASLAAMQARNTEWMGLPAPAAKRNELG